MVPPNEGTEPGSTSLDLESSVNLRMASKSQVDNGASSKSDHTWHPSGNYPIEATPILREEVIPIRLDDVRSPSPVFVPQKEEPKKAEQEAKTEPEKVTLEYLPPTLPQFPSEEANTFTIPDGIPLLARVLPKDDDTSHEKIPLERIFTPASDFEGIAHKKKKLFASSDFYGPNHPTIDDQLELAHKISGSLMATTNNTSKGQEMYERRKQKSHKWVNSTSSSAMEVESSETMEIKSTQSKLKLVLNSNTVHDQSNMYNTQHMQMLPKEFPSPEILQPIGNDLNSPTGRGAELFAKRKKLMDKFVVDGKNVERNIVYQTKGQQNGVLTTVGSPTVYTAEVKLQEAPIQYPEITSRLASDSTAGNISTSSSYISSNKHSITSQSTKAQDAFQLPASLPVQSDVTPPTNVPTYKLPTSNPNINYDKNKEYNFNFAASGFGTYNSFYRPVSFVVTKH